MKEWIVGCWHAHILLKDLKNEQLDISNEDVAKIWKKGITDTKRVNEKEVKSIGDIKEDEEIQEREETEGIERIASYMSKTSQLWEVPVGICPYSFTKGLKKETREQMPYQESMKKLGNNYVLVHEQTKLIRSMRTGKIINMHKTEKYKKDK